MQTSQNLLVLQSFPLYDQQDSHQNQFFLWTVGDEAVKWWRWLVMSEIRLRLVDYRKLSSIYITDSGKGKAQPLWVASFMEFSAGRLKVNGL